MNIIIQLTKKTHEVNVIKGKVLNRILKGLSIDHNTVHSVIVEQASIIDEYHKNLKDALDKNEILERQINHLKKEVQPESIITFTTASARKKKKDKTLLKTDCKN
jgi:cell division protein FtsB